MGLTIALNGLIWYSYLKFYHDLIGFVPIAYSTAVFVLNVFLAVPVYKRESLASYILLTAGLFIQIIYLVFLRFFALSQAF